MKYKLKCRELAWCLYDAGNSAFSLIVMTSFFPVYYSGMIADRISGPSSATGSLGFTNSAAGFAAALAAPFLGALADRHGAKKTGLFWSILAGCAATALLGVFDGGLALLILYGTAVFAFIGGNVFYDSMLPDVASADRSDYISGAGFALGYIGSVIPFSILLGFLAVFGENAGCFRAGFLLTAVWWAVFSIPLFRTVRVCGIVSGPKKTGTSFFRSMRGTVGKIRKNKNLTRFLLAYFLYIDGVDTIIVMAIPYGAEIGLRPVHMILTVLGIQIIAFPCSLLYGVLGTLFGAKRMILCAVVFYSAAVTAAAFLPYLPGEGSKILLFLLIALLIAANQGGVQALSRSFFSTLIPRESAAEYFGFYNIFGKFATVTGPLLVGLSGYFLGGSQFGILSLLFLFAAGGFFLSKIRVENEKISV